MSRYTVSTCHSVEIIPISRLIRFARLGSRVEMMLVCDPDDAHAVPGSIKLSQSSAGGVLKKKITYERSDVSAEATNELEAYKSLRLVAVYVDESGRRRVAGSPDYPLTLDYSTGGGVFAVTLEGEDTSQDAFLAE